MSTEPNANRDVRDFDGLASDLGAIVIRFMGQQMDAIWASAAVADIVSGERPVHAAGAMQKPHTFVQVNYLARVRAQLLNPVQRQAAESDLFLVDADEIDEFSTINAMQSRAMNMFRHRIEYLEARLEYVNGHIEEQLHLGNFLAESFCNSLQEALKEAGYPADMREAVYAAFNDHVIANLGDLYERLNQRLAQAGVLPSLGENKIHVDPRVYGRENVNVKNPDNTRNAHGCATSRHAYANAKPREVRNVFNAYIHGDSLGDTQHYSTRTGAHSNTFTRDELLDALTTLQMRMIYASGSEQRLDDEYIKNALIGQMQRRYIRKGSEQLHVMDVRLIEFVGMMFEAFTDDPIISRPIVSQVLRLQVPVIKAAMIDADVFVDENHPVRRVLECIVAAGDDVYTEEDEVYAEIDAIVQDLIRNYLYDANEFVIAADSLRILIEHKPTKYNSRQRQARKAQLFGIARNAVLEEVKAITHNKVINAKVKTLVLKHLPSLMTQRHIKKGVDSRAWKHAVALTQKVVRLIQPKGSEKAWLELEEQHAEVIETLRWELLRSRQSPGTIESSIDGLQETFERLLASRHSATQTTAGQAGVPEDSDVHTDPVTAQAPVTATPVPAEADQAAAAVVSAGNDEAPAAAPATDIAETASIAAGAGEAEHRPEPEQAADSTIVPDCIRPGLWFEVYDGEDRPVRRLKLSRVIDEEARLIFVNSRSMHVIDKDISVFIRELNESKSRLYADSTPFEAALGQVIHRLVA